MHLSSGRTNYSPVKVMIKSADTFNESPRDLREVNTNNSHKDFNSSTSSTLKSHRRSSSRHLRRQTSVGRQDLNGNYLTFDRSQPDANFNSYQRHDQRQSYLRVSTNQQDLIDELRFKMQTNNDANNNNNNSNNNFEEILLDANVDAEQKSKQTLDKCRQQLPSFTQLDEGFQPKFEYFGPPLQQQQQQTTATQPMSQQLFANGSGKLPFGANYLSSGQSLNRMNINANGTGGQKKHNFEPQADQVYVTNCCGLSFIGDATTKSMSTFKVFFYVFNVLVFVFGFGDFGLGLWFRIDPKVYEIHEYIETQNFTIAGWVLLFAGFGVCLVSFLGFVGASKNSSKLLAFYAISLIALTVLFVGSLVLLSVYGFGSTLERFLTKEIFEQIRMRATSIEAAQFLDFVQVKLRCCGAEGHTDYTKLGMYTPTSCYAIDRNYISAPGCGQALRQLFDIRGGLAVGFLCASVIVQVTTVILSSVILCTIAQSRTKRKQLAKQQQQQQQSCNLNLNQF